jgi:hypothetical protein
VISGPYRGLANVLGVEVGRRGQVVEVVDAVPGEATLVTAVADDAPALRRRLRFNELAPGSDAFARPRQ